ncbi:MAG: hypothetical protein HY906_15340, partial [Deltaproteobacteria bacterium]|nr:hypothetical protein [Deltaproteobacteria bacterium]
MHRRRFLEGLLGVAGAAAVGVLAGCGSKRGGGEGAASGAAGGPAGASGAAGG